MILQINMRAKSDRKKNKKAHSSKGEKKKFIVVESEFEGLDSKMKQKHYSGQIRDILKL